MPKLIPSEEGRDPHLADMKSAWIFDTAVVQLTLLMPSRCSFNPVNHQDETPTVPEPWRGCRWGNDVAMAGDRAVVRTREIHIT